MLVSFLSENGGCFLSRKRNTEKLNKGAVSNKGCKNLYLDSSILLFCCWECKISQGQLVNFTESLYAPFHSEIQLLLIYSKKIFREGYVDKCTWIVFTVMFIINFKVENILSDNGGLK